MSSLPDGTVLTVWAQWLSDHVLEVTLSLALFALVSEGALRFAFRQHSASQNSTRQWIFTWLTNIVLLACAMLVSWALGPWLSPWFSDALSGKTGLLVWLGFDHGAASALHVITGILLLDLMAYALHRVLHAVPLFWRLHQVHHSDTAMNASTHFRQHPLQLIAVSAMQLPLLWLLGVSGISWVLYTALAAVVELWHHASMRLPTALDRWLSWCVVTPGFHRTHHHPERKFHDANYSAVFPVWDRLFGTASAVPQAAPVGLSRWHPAGSDAVIGADACLAMPFHPLIEPAQSAPAKVRARNLVTTPPQNIRKLRTNTRGKT